MAGREDGPALDRIWILEAAKGFRRLKAHQQLPVLKATLLKHREPDADGVDQTAEAA